MRCVTFGSIMTWKHHFTFNKQEISIPESKKIKYLTIYAVVSLYNFLFVAHNVLIFIMIVDIYSNTSNVRKKIARRKYVPCVELKNLIIQRWESSFNQCLIFKPSEWRKIKISSRIEEGQSCKMINHNNFYKAHKSLAC